MNKEVRELSADIATILIQSLTDFTYRDAVLTELIYKLKKII